MITGIDEPDKGEVVVGETVKLMYVDQSRDSLNGGKTVFEERLRRRGAILVSGREP